MTKWQERRIIRALWLLNITLQVLMIARSI